MKTPVIRLVCSNCMRSVEMTADGLSAVPQRCMYCGGPFESDASQVERSPESLVGASGSGLDSDEPTPQFETVDHGNGMGTIGRFQIRETLGGGGFGFVFRAYDPRLDREVALKVLKETQPGARIMERFFREARAASRLDHANIVCLHDAGRDAGRCWIAYQYIKGATLTRVQEQGLLDRRGAVKVVWALARALGHAHARGVFHRDLKPSNVLIDESGEPRLTDFGLARRVDFESTLTKEGAVLGTPAYMSPEQAEGHSHQADARSDVYSLGVILYELLCHRRPIELPTGVPVWRAAQAPPAQPPRRIDRSIPRALDRVCRRALAKNPAERYPDAQSLADDLEQWLEDTPRHSRPVKWLTGVNAALFLAALCLTGADLSKKGGPATTPTHPAALIVAGKPAPASPRPGAELPPVPTGSPQRALLSDPPVVEHPAFTIVGNSASRVYHRPTCASAGKMSAKNRVEFATTAEAQAQRYKPCSTCLPDANSGHPAPPNR